MLAPTKHCNRRRVGSLQCRGWDIALFFSSNDSHSMPLFFASSALMPYCEMAAWLLFLAHLNPVSYAIDSVRELFMGGVPVSGMIGLAAAGVMVCVGTVQFRRSGV